MALAVVVVLLVVGSIIFHFMQLYGGPWYFTELAADSVSYTHLTLPTILLV